MREPAHDDAISPDHLLAVDAEVLPLLLGAARDGEAPGDERPGVAGPAVLDRQAREIDVVSFAHDLVAGGPGGAPPRPVRPAFLKGGIFPPGPPAPWRGGGPLEHEQAAAPPPTPPRARPPPPPH